MTGYFKELTRAGFSAGDATAMASIFVRNGGMQAAHEALAQKFGIYALPGVLVMMKPIQAQESEDPRIEEAIAYIRSSWAGLGYGEPASGTAAGDLIAILRRGRVVHGE